MTEVKVENKPNAAAPEKVTTATPAPSVPLTDKQLAILQAALIKGTLHPITQVLVETEERKVDQRQEQQLYSSVWGGVVAAIVKTSTHDTERLAAERRKLDALQEEMFLALTAEKKKRAFRDSPFFQQLVTILGHDVAESVTKKIEAASSSAPSGLQANQAALAQLVKEIAAILEKSHASLKLSATGASLEKSIATEIAGAITIAQQRGSNPAVNELHDIVTGSSNREELITRMFGPRGRMSADEFARALDAYDKKHGIPLAVHAAKYSSASSEVQAEMIGELKGLLTPAQKIRLDEYAKAEYAQSLAVLDVKREQAKDSLPIVDAEIRKVERELSNELKAAELHSVPAAEIRGKLLAAMVKKFPELKGKSWDEVRKALTEKNDQNAKNTSPADESDVAKEARLLPARLATLMNKAASLDQQAAGLKEVINGDPAGERAVLKEHFAKAYGAAITTSGAQLDQQVKAAGTYLRHLHKRIADSATSSVERERLIKERDSIDFSVAKTRVAHYLTPGKEQPEKARAALSEFAGAYAGTPYGRGAQYLKLSAEMDKAIRAAVEYKKEWEKVHIRIPVRPNALLKAESCTDGRPKQSNAFQLSLPPKGDLSALLTNQNKSASPKKDQDLAEALKFIKGGNKATTDTKPNTPKPLTSIELEQKLTVQKVEALSTHWFSQVLEPGVPLKKGHGLADAVIKGVIATDEGRLPRLAEVADEMNSSNQFSRALFTTLEGEPTNSFLRSESLQQLTKPLSPDLAKKIGVTTSTDLATKLSDELDPTKLLAPEKGVLENLRRVAGDKGPIADALKAIAPGKLAPQVELQEILTRLNPVDALRVRTFATIDTANIIRGRATDATSLWKAISTADPKEIARDESAFITDARLARIERMLGEVSDKEREEVEQLFKLHTGQRIGQVLLQDLPITSDRANILITLAGSRLLTSEDLNSFYSGPVPLSIPERVTLLKQNFDADQRRPEFTAGAAGEELFKYVREEAAIRAAATLAATNGQQELLDETAGKLRSHDARQQGLIARALASVDQAYAARQGLKDQIVIRHEHVVTENQAKLLDPNGSINRRAKDAASLLQAKEPKTEAAFSTIRNGNFSQEETLLFRAAYAQHARSPSYGADARAVTGDLSRDLQGKGGVSSFERERITCLLAGGKDALDRLDKITLEHAISEKNALLQMQALSAMRAAGSFAQVDASKLTGDARSYHDAVVAKDKVKEETLDLKTKAKTGEIKDEHVSKYLEGKSPDDIKRAKEIYPEMGKDIAATVPEWQKNIERYLSAQAEERKKALEAEVFAALKDPALFARRLNLEPSPQERMELLQKITEMVEKSPTAPKYVSSGMSKIGQYVLAQRTDFREIDAKLIDSIVVSTLSTGHPLDNGTIARIANLREAAVSQIKAIDAYSDPYHQIHGAGVEYLKSLGNHRNALNREQEKRFHFTSGYILDNDIKVSEATYNKQLTHLRPLGKGIDDIHSSRELVRTGFAIMADDIIAKVDRGITPEATQHVLTLLQQRNAKIEWKVRDEEQHKLWLATTEQATRDLASRDKYISIGLTVGKVAGTVAVSFFFTPAAGLAFATAWNVGDKAYRVGVLGESWQSALKAGAWELAGDTLLMALASVRVTKVFAGNGSATVSKRFWEFTPFTRTRALTDIQKLAQGQRIAHFTELTTKVSGPLREGVTEIAKLSEPIVKFGKDAFANLAKVNPAHVPSSIQFGQGWSVKLLQGAVPAMPESEPLKKQENVSKPVEEVTKKPLAAPEFYGTPPVAKKKETPDELIVEVNNKTFEEVTRTQPPTTEPAREKQAELALVVPQELPKKEQPQKPNEAFVPWQDLANRIPGLLSGENPWTAWLKGGPLPELPQLPPQPPILPAVQTSTPETTSNGGTPGAGRPGPNLAPSDDKTGNAYTREMDKEKSRIADSNAGSDSDSNSNGDSAKNGEQAKNGNPDSLLKEATFTRIAAFNREGQPALVETPERQKVPVEAIAVKDSNPAAIGTVTVPPAAIPTIELRQVALASDKVEKIPAPPSAIEEKLLGKGDAHQVTEAAEKTTFTRIAALNREAQPALVETPERQKVPVEAIAVKDSNPAAIGTVTVPPAAIPTIELRQVDLTPDKVQKISAPALAIEEKPLGKGEAHPVTEIVEKAAFTRIAAFNRDGQPALVETPERQKVPVEAIAAKDSTPAPLSTTAIPSTVTPSFQLAGLDLASDKVQVQKTPAPAAVAIIPNAEALLIARTGVEDTLTRDTKLSREMQSSQIEAQSQIARQTSLLNPTASHVSISDVPLMRAVSTDSRPSVASSLADNSKSAQATLTTRVQDDSRISDQRAVTPITTYTAAKVPQAITASLQSGPELRAGVGMKTTRDLPLFKTTSEPARMLENSLVQKGEDAAVAQRAIRETEEKRASILQTTPSYRTTSPSLSAASTRAQAQASEISAVASSAMMMERSAPTFTEYASRQSVTSTPAQGQASAASTAATPAMIIDQLLPSFPQYAILQGVSLEDELTAKAKKKARSRSVGDDARMRDLILLQLMTKRYTQIQRDKLLRMLVHLGISETEYRTLVVRLGELELSRRAEQKAGNRVAVEALEEEVQQQASPTKKDAPPTVNKTNRAALYKKLRAEALAKRNVA